MFNVIDVLGTVRATASTRELAQAELDDLQIRTGITFLKVVAA